MASGRRREGQAPRYCRSVRTVIGKQGEISQAKGSLILSRDKQGEQESRVIISFESEKEYFTVRKLE